jgi:selenium-binding protein 1
MDDNFLYVACWATGEMRQYDVREPRKPKLAGSVQIGGIARARRIRTARRLRGTANGRDQPRRQAGVLDQLAVFDSGTTSSIPTVSPGAMVMANAKPDGGLELAKDYWVNFPDGYARTRSGSTAVTVRRIRSAIRRFECERSRLDAMPGSGWL